MSLVRCILSNVHWKELCLTRFCVQLIWNWIICSAYAGLFLGVRWVWVDLLRRPLIGLLYHPRMMMIVEHPRKPFPVSLYPPQISHDLTNKKNKLHSLSPRANYTDRATAACRRSDCQLLRIKGATWSTWRIPRPYSRFSRQEPLLFYQVAPQLYSRGWVDPVPDPLLFFLVVLGIEPGPPDL
jgi:hypothetical protein